MSIPPPPGPERSGRPADPQAPEQPSGPQPPRPPEDTRPDRPPHTPHPVPGTHPHGPHPVPGAPYPYQPWGQGYSPFNRPAPVNGLAVASLVLGILCFVPFVGLVLGLFALGQIRRKGERGKEMAVAGSVLSSLGLALWVLVLATGLLSDIRDGVESAAGGGSAYSLTEGECFDAPGGYLGGYAYDVDQVPCAGEHDAEVFAVFTLTGHDPYPGDDRVEDLAGTRCYALRHAYAMDAWAVPGDVDVYYLTPTRESWRYGDREVTCLFGNTEERAGLTGSLRNDATVLDADQRAYLSAVAVEGKALDQEPLETAEDDLAANRKWAGRMAAALGTEAGRLRDHDWPAEASGPVADVADELGPIRKEWARAAEAADADAFYAHYDRIVELSAPDRSITARKALGLATTPPSDDGSGDGGSGGGGESGLEV